jgi:hypothetical protein
MAPRRADRIGGAIGAVLWLGAAIWIAVVPGLGVGWKVLFVVFAVTGCVNYVYVFTRSETLFKVLARAFRRHLTDRRHEGVDDQRNDS